MKEKVVKVEDEEKGAAREFGGTGRTGTERKTLRSRKDMQYQQPNLELDEVKSASTNNS